MRGQLKYDPPIKKISNHFLAERPICTISRMSNDPRRRKSLDVRPDLLRGFPRKVGSAKRFASCVIRVLKITVRRKRDAQRYLCRSAGSRGYHVAIRVARRWLSKEKEQRDLDTQSAGGESGRIYRVESKICDRALIGLGGEQGREAAGAEPAIDH